MYTTNNRRYHSAVDDKENNFLNLESDSEDVEMTLSICDLPYSPTVASKAENKCFDLSLDSDTESDFDETLSIELDCDECDEGDDLFCSMQEEQSENITEPSEDQLVFKITDVPVPSLSFNDLTDFDQNSEIYMDLSSHGATVEVLAVSNKATEGCDVKNIATTSGTITADRLCSNTATTVCFTSSQSYTNEDVYSPVNTTINAELADEQKQNCMCGSPDTHINSHVGDNESVCITVSTPSVVPPEAHHLPVENVS